MKTAKMKIVLISVLCGVIMTLNEAYGKTLLRLESKVNSDKKWVSQFKGRSPLVWVRINEKEICTGFIVGGKAFMTTGDCALQIETKNSESLALRRSELEVYYKTFHCGKPFITNFVKHIELHPHYKYRDTERKKKFSKYNFGLIFVKKFFNGNYALEIDVPLYTQVITEKDKFTVLGWDSSIFGKKFSEIYQELEVREVTVFILGFRKCEKMYGEAKFILKEYDEYRCVEIVDGSKLTKEDIGSPVLDDKVVEGIIAYVPDPSLNLPALMITRSKIESRLHFPNDSCSYYDTNLKAWKGIVDPADVEFENVEPEDVNPEIDNSTEGVRKRNSNPTSNSSPKKRKRNKNNDKKNV